ncbi:hypothetical protein IJM86_05410 [bacterium]|nr:hypothetical protein [bacterium]
MFKTYEVHQARAAISAPLVIARTILVLSNFFVAVLYSFSLSSNVVLYNVSVSKWLLSIPSLSHQAFRSINNLFTSSSACSFVEEYKVLCHFSLWNFIFAHAICKYSFKASCSVGSKFIF